MSLHFIIAYVLIGFATASLFTVYLHLTRERRAIDRCERTYRRLQRRRQRLPQP